MADTLTGGFSGVDPKKTLRAQNDVVTPAAAPIVPPVASSAAPVVPGGMNIQPAAPVETLGQKNLRQQAEFAAKTAANNAPVAMPSGGIDGTVGKDGVTAVDAN